MLQTDLNGCIEYFKKNALCKFAILVLGCVIIYCAISKYISTKQTSKLNFNNVLQGNPYSGINGIKMDNCKGDIPKMDEAIIKNMINIPNRDPKLLTSSMVFPETLNTSDEKRKQTRMDILNMFYSSFDDDLTSFNKRPRGLYLTP